MSTNKKVFATASMKDTFERPLQRMVNFPGYTMLACPSPTRQPLRRRATIDTVTRSSSSSTLPRPGGANSAKLPVDGSLTKSQSEVDVLACHLAVKYHLTLNEVKNIKHLFKLEGVDGVTRQGLYEIELHSVLCQLFNVKTVDPSMLHGAYEASKTDQGAVLEKFLQWYIQHMFCDVSDMNADAERNFSDKMVKRLASEHNVNEVWIDKIKQQFDHFDLDANGIIDYEEFQNMFSIILKAKSAQDLNPKQILHFWREIDKDGSGGIDFAEFTEWYLKCFDPKKNENVFNTSGVSLMEHYYDSFNPTKQRRHSLQMMRRKTTE